MTEDKTDLANHIENVHYLREDNSLAKVTEYSHISSPYKPETVVICGTCAEGFENEGLYTIQCMQKSMTSITLINV